MRGKKSRTRLDSGTLAQSRRLSKSLYYRTGMSKNKRDYERF
uniref:Uncharacterized protein n=1 Tax=Anguilla anguilla TaxID=7936 RepID=A0A0E9VE34_ANGAN